jgi:hypothetical protein
MFLAFVAATLVIMFRARKSQVYRLLPLPPDYWQNGPAAL